MTHAPSATFFRFAAVGSVGFVADAALFFLLLHALSWHWAPARLVAFLGAVTLTWAGNRSYTFGSQGAPRREALRYLLAQSTGCGINYLTFLAVMTTGAADSRLILPYLLGTAAGLVFNYAAARGFVFRQP